MSLLIDNNIKSLANESLRLLRAQLSMPFIALKLLLTVAVPTGMVFDTLITLDRFGYSLESMYFPAVVIILALSHSVLRRPESILRQFPNRSAKGLWFDASKASIALKISTLLLEKRRSSSCSRNGTDDFRLSHKSRESSSSFSLTSVMESS